MATGEPRYVRKISAESGDVIAGSYDELKAMGLVARSVSLVDPEASTAEMPAEVKIRYRASAIPATVRMTSVDSAEVRFVSGGPAVSPGQACVFYRGDEVIGGGFIESAIER